MIKTYVPDTAEYKALANAAAILTATSKKGVTYTVGDCYFDFGQDWIWTTILANNPNSEWGSYQALCPRDYEKILRSDDLLTTIAEIKADKYWSDK